jgi:hypothetical protein
MEQKIMYIVTPGVRYAGFFSYFNQVLSNLHILTNNDKMLVKFDHNNPYMDVSKNVNMWENYFYQPTEVDCDDFNTYTVLTETWFNGRYEIPFPPTSITDNDIDTCNALIKKYIKIKPHIEAKLSAFYANHFSGKKVLSVHKRGTDHYKEVKPLHVNEYFQCTDNIIDDFDNIFLCTDEQQTVKDFCSRYGDKLITYDSIRAELNNKSGVHYSSGAFNPYLMGEQVLIETLLMSKTNFLIKTVSNVSNAALFFNKNLQYKEIKSI